MHLSPDTYSAQAIGARMARARTRAGYTLEDAARACMMEPKVLGAHERGTRAAPDDALLVRLAGLYHTHPAVLRYGDHALRDAIATEVAAALERAADELRRVGGELGVTLGTPVTTLRAAQS